MQGNQPSGAGTSWGYCQRPTSVAAGLAFRLKSSPALLFQLPPAPGVVNRDDWGLRVDGACTYAIAPLACCGGASRGSGSSTRSSTTTPITTLVSTPLDDKQPFDRESVNVRCRIPPTERGKLCRPAIRCTCVTCSLSTLRAVSSSTEDDTELSESALRFCATRSSSVQQIGQKRAPASERHTSNCASYNGANGVVLRTLAVGPCGMPSVVCCVVPSI
jgi:hypothetical protein